MPWTEKYQPTAFDYREIEGMFYLDGDVLALRIRREWTKGQKYPMIAFPSGAQLDLWESGDPERLGIVHIFGELDLPLIDSRDRAFEQACDIAEQCGYSAQKLGEYGLEVMGQDDDEHFLILYDHEKHVMADVLAVTEEVRQWAKENLGGTVATEKPIPPGLDLFPQAVREQLPPLYSGEEQGLEAEALVKYFSPDGGWTWWASECSAVISNGDETRYLPLSEQLPEGWQVIDHLFFGLVAGFEVELGYFSLSELQEARGPLGLPIERDLYFAPTNLEAVRQEQHRLRGE